MPTLTVNTPNAPPPPSKRMAGNSWHVRPEPSGSKAGSARNVIVRFPSLEDAEACYRSAAYREALTFADGAAERDLCIVEGN